jgi:hypothetical protein
MTPRAILGSIALIAVPMPLGHCSPAASGAGSGAAAGASSSVTSTAGSRGQSASAQASGNVLAGSASGGAESGSSAGIALGESSTGSKLGSMSGSTLGASGSTSGATSGSVADAASEHDASSGSAASSGAASSGAASSGAASSGAAGTDSGSQTQSLDAGSGPEPGGCTWGSAQERTGSFTWYYFGQGTYRQNGAFKTACGYTGTESGAGQSAADTVSHIASTAPAKSTYFAAIPGMSSSHFDTVTDCGACVEITGMNGSKIVATVVDECPADTNPKCGAGHLDLSTQAFDALGYASGDPTGTTWRFVACPVTGTIVTVPNGNNQFYFQNAVYPIAQVNGQGPTNYGYFNVAPGAVTITSTVVGQTVHGTIPGSGGGDTGAQFTAPSSCD